MCKTILIACAALSLVLSMAGCSADADVVVSPDESEIDTQLFNTGGFSNQSGVRCYSLSCPDGKQDGCFIPCMKQPGQTVTGCATACGCTATPRDCTSKLSIQ